MCASQNTISGPAFCAAHLSDSYTVVEERVGEIRTVTRTPRNLAHLPGKRAGVVMNSHRAPETVVAALRDLFQVALVDLHGRALLQEPDGHEQPRFTVPAEHDPFLPHERAGTHADFGARFKFRFG